MAHIKHSAFLLLMFLTLVSAATAFSSAEQMATVITSQTPLTTSLKSSAADTPVSPQGPVSSVLVNLTTTITGTPLPTEGVTVQTSVQANSTIMVAVSTLTTVPSETTTAIITSTILNLISTSTIDSNGVVTSTAHSSKTTIASASGSASASPGPQNAAAKVGEASVKGIVVLAGVLGFGALGALGA